MDYKAFARDIILSARKKGIEQTEILLIREESKEISIRNGQMDSINENISLSSRIKLIKEKKNYLISFSNFDKAKIEKAIEDSLKYLKLQKADDAISLPPEKELGSVSGELFIEDKEKIPSTDTIKKKLIKMEKNAFEYDKKIKYSEGAFYNFSRMNIHIANSLGFYGEFSKTAHLFYISVVAEEKGEKRTGSFWSENIFFDALENEKILGVKAGERALRKLGSKKPKTGEYPVIFDNITASSIVEILSELVNGENAYKRNSVFSDKLGEIVGSSIITIMDNPLIKKLQGSRPFDGEGVYSREKFIFNKGKLASYIVNNYYSKKLKHRITSNSSFETETINGISPSNFYLIPGEIDEGDLIGSVKKGIYITGLFSVDSINTATGDFSWGAEGFMIERGKLSYPISEFTIAGNIIDLLKNTIEICDNIDFNRGEIASPSILVNKGITIGGK